MILQRLLMHNFMPYYGDVSIDFPTDMNANMVIFHGENTKGKTSILNAFRWVLYGEAESKGMILSYDDLLNKKAASEGQGEIFVELTFTSGGARYVLTRRHKSNAETNAQILLLIDDVPVDLESAKREIERIAPSGTKRFFLFDGELLREYEELMTPTTATAKKIKNAIEDVMGFPALTNGIKALESVERKLKQEAKQDKSANAAIEKLRSERDEVEQQLNSKRDELEKLEVNLENHSADLETVNRSLENSQSSRGLIDDLKSKEALQNGRKQAMDDLNIELRESKSSAWKSLVKGRISSLGKQAQLHQQSLDEMNKKLITAQIRIDTYAKMQGSDTCSTCNQPIPHSTNFEVEITSLKSEISKLTREIETIPNPANVLAAERVFLASSPIEDVLLKEQKLIDMEKQYMLTQQDMMGQRQKLLDMGTENIDDKSKEIEAQMRRKFALENVIDETSSAIEQLETDIKRLKDEDIRLSEQIRNNSAGNEVVSETALRACQAVSSIFEDAKQVLRDNIKEKVEAAAQRAFLEMTSRPEDYSGLEITDSYGLKMLASDGTEVPQRSAGAEQVVALALIDGLNRVGKSAGPVLMDTPFGRLDQTHRKNILSYMPRSARQFIVFVHSGELEDDAKVLEALSHRIGKRYRIKSNGAFVSYLENM